MKNRVDEGRGSVKKIEAFIPAWQKVDAAEEIPDIGEESLDATHQQAGDSGQSHAELLQQAVEAGNRIEPQEAFKKFAQLGQPAGGPAGDGFDDLVQDGVESRGGIECQEAAKEVAQILKGAVCHPGDRMDDLPGHVAEPGQDAREVGQRPSGQISDGLNHLAEQIACLRRESRKKRRQRRNIGSAAQDGRGSPSGATDQRIGTANPGIHFLLGRVQVESVVHSGGGKHRPGSVLKNPVLDLAVGNNSAHQIGLGGQGGAQVGDVGSLQGDHAGLACYRFHRPAAGSFTGTQRHCPVRPAVYRALQNPIAVPVQRGAQPQRGVHLNL